jgi:hypothetical protein
VTGWGFLLLVTYVSLALSRAAAPKVVRTALVITTVVVSYAMVKTGASG